jgi:UDP-N-acetylmuramate: L-alanyl-gamma-D-glutamyl-meso-diaminopimelate ligase
LSEKVLQGRHVLAVAGTHGKTTTTSMLAWVLEHAGLQPGFLVGGVPENFGVSARMGQQGAPFVIEADEYDTAFFDKRSKFVHYRPRTAILNNLEFDHADIFPTLGAIETQFHHLVRTVPGKGRIVLNAREDSLQRVIDRGCWSELVRFGARGDAPGWRARGEPHAFDVLKSGVKVGRVDWPLLGEHNQMNALATLAAAEHVGVTPEAASQALGEFRNVKRRMEISGVVAGVTVYDDFAHHPTAIRTTIDGLRRRVGPLGVGDRILAIFEPRSNTMKLGAMKAQLPWALEEADLSFCHSAGLSWNATEALAPLGAQAVVCEDLTVLIKKVVAAAQPGDHLLCMSNGGFSGIHAKLLAALRAKFG